MRGAVGRGLVLGLGWDLRQACVEQNRLDRRHRRCNVVIVHDTVLVVVGLKQLPSGHLQSAGHRVR
jgi:hypothetical protein